MTLFDTDMQHFNLTTQHIALLRHARVSWESCEFGAPSINCKRPYGNSSVYQDIAEILGIEPELTDDWDDPAFSDRQRAMMDRIHEETQTALAVILRTGQFTPDTYVAERYTQNWMPLTSASGTEAQADPPDASSSPTPDGTEP